MATFNGEIAYSPQVAFDFSFIGEVTANDVVLDYLELIWCGYFTVLFGMLGSELERCAAFVFQMHIFGFYSIWTQMRANPVFIDAYIFESLCRCTVSAILGTTIAAMFKVDDMVEIYTIVTLGSGYFINLMDPSFRSVGECDGIGPPTPEFPHGVWLDCDNWKMAYAVTWINAGFKYLAVGTCIVLLHCLQRNEFVMRMSTHLAVAMIATSSGVTFLRSLIRIEEIQDGNFDTFVEYSFYIFLTTSFVVQEIIHRARKCWKKRQKVENSKRLTDISRLIDKRRLFINRCKAYCCCWARIVGLIVVGLTMPLYWTDQGLKWLIRKVIEINTEELDAEIERISKPSDLIEVDKLWEAVKRNSQYSIDSKENVGRIRTVELQQTNEKENSLPDNDIVSQKPNKEKPQPLEVTQSSNDSPPNEEQSKDIISMNALEPNKNQEDRV